MKKVIGASMIVLIILIISAVAFFYSQKYSVLPSDPINAIPSDAAYIIELPNGKEALSKLTSQAFYKTWKNLPSFSQINSSIHLIDSLFAKDPLLTSIWNKETIRFSAHPTKAADFDFLFVCNIPVRSGESDINHAVESITGNNFSVATREYEDVNLYELRKENELLITYAFSNGILLASKTPFLVESGIRQLKTGISIKKSKAFSRVKIDSKKELKIYFNLAELQNLLNGYLNPENDFLNGAFSSLSKWAGFEIALKGNQTDGNGFMAATDSSSLISAFAGQAASPSSLPSLLPSRTAFFLELNGNNIPELISRLEYNVAFFNGRTNEKEILKKLSEKAGINLHDDLKNWIGNSVSLIITEAGNTVLDNNIYACIKVNDTKNLLRTIKKIQQSAGNKTDETYKNYPVGTINVNGLAPLWFGDMFSSINANAFAIFKEHLIFANQLSNIKSLIDDLENNRSFSSTAEYSSFGKNFFTGNLNVYMDCPKSDNILLAGGNDALSSTMETYRQQWNSFSSAAISVRYEKDKCPARFRLNFSGTSSEQKMNLLWAAQLDTNLLTSPALISGNNGNFIAIQDKKNQLYLFDEAGRMIWKKEMTEAIIGSIHSVDYYKNGGSQILFNTSGSIFLYDLKGNAVGRYPVKLPAPATCGLTLADLNGTGKSNMVIACENGMIYSYELSGKPVSDWLFNKFIHTSGEPLLYSSAGNERQLIFRDDKGKVLISDSRGRVRTIKIDLNPSLPVIALKDSSTLIYAGVNNTGQVVTFNAEGMIKSFLIPDSIVDLGKSVINGNHRIQVATNDTLFTLSAELELLEATAVNPGDYNFSLDQSNTGQSALIDKNLQQLTLITSEGFPNSTLQAKGSTDFHLIPSLKQGVKNKLLVGDTESGIYLYGY